MELHLSLPATVSNEQPFSIVGGFVISLITEIKVRAEERYGTTRTKGGPGEERAQRGPWNREGKLQPHQGQALGQTGHGGHRRGLEEGAKSNVGEAQCGQLGLVKAESLFLGLGHHT